MNTHSIPHPVRSWRSALVIACLVGTMGVCAVLAGEVREARAALRATAAQTLHDYAGYVGRVIGTEIFRRDRAMRDALFAPVMHATAGPPIAIDAFARHADSVFTSTHNDSDSLRGYLRLDLVGEKWSAAGALTDSVLARRVVDTIEALRRSPQVVPASGLVVLAHGTQSMSTSYMVVNDSTAPRLYAYIISQTRSVAFQQVVGETIESTPLLPPSFAGSQWNVDAPVAPRIPNDSLVGVRIVGSDGRLLYTSANWFDSPYHGSYEFQTGPGGFTIETVLRPGLEQRLVPASIEKASRTLYGGMALLGVFLLTVSFVAFWGEMRQREAQRAQAIRQLTTGLRHELNNALASVLLEAQLLETSREHAADVRESAGAIAEQAQRMRDVLRRLDHVEHLPVVDYIDGQSMVDLASTSSWPTPTGFLKGKSGGKPHAA